MNKRQHVKKAKLYRETQLAVNQALSDIDKLFFNIELDEAERLLLDKALSQLQATQSTLIKARLAGLADLTDDAIMQHNNSMISYITQLQDAADRAEVSLIEAFKQSGTPTSTFYRAKNGVICTCPQRKKVEDAIKVYSLQKSTGRTDSWQDVVASLTMLRMEKGMSQEALAGKIGCATSLIHKWERMKRFPLVSYLFVGQMPLARKSKSRYNRIGKSATCHCCEIKSPWFIVRGDNVVLCLNCYENNMGTSQRNKGSYHERWWVEFFKEKGAEARRQPLSGSMGGELGGDIKITTKFGSVIAESKYQSAGRGFSSLQKPTKNNQRISICSSSGQGLLSCA